MHPDIIFRHDARIDVIGHVHYYLHRDAETTASRFRAALDRTLEGCRKNPGLHTSRNRENLL